MERVIQPDHKVAVRDRMGAPQVFYVTGEEATPDEVRDYVLQTMPSVKVVLVLIPGSKGVRSNIVPLKVA